MPPGESPTVCNRPRASSAAPIPARLCVSLQGPACGPPVRPLAIRWPLPSGNLMAETRCQGSFGGRGAGGTPRGRRRRRRGGTRRCSPPPLAAPPPPAPEGRARESAAARPRACVRVATCARAGECAQDPRRRRGPFKEPEGAGPGASVRAGSREPRGRAAASPARAPPPAPPPAVAAGERSRGQAGPHRSPASARAPPQPCARALRPAMRAKLRAGDPGLAP